MVDIEKVDCQLCGSSEADNVLRRRDLLLKGSEEFQLVRCRNCGLVYQNPRPTRQGMDRYYPPSYFESIGGDIQRLRWDGKLEYRWAMARRCSVVIKKFGRDHGKLLDLGCGTGDFLNAMAARGWEVTGVDTSADAVSIARERYGLNARDGSIQELDLPDESFDAITLWDVVEHLHDLRGTFTRCHALLRPNGLLVVSTPNIGSLEARLFGTYWQGLELPRHLYLFEGRTITRLLEVTGFAPVQLFTRVRWGDIVASTQYAIEDNARHPFWVKLARRTLASLAPRAATIPYRWFAERMGSGSTLIAVARRRSEGG